MNQRRYRLIKIGDDVPDKFGRRKHFSGLAVMIPIKQIKPKIKPERITRFGGRIGKNER